MEQINYNRRHTIKVNSLQTREISLLLSFVYKVDFSITVEDEAKNKIQEVISGIDKMFK